MIPDRWYPILESSKLRKRPVGVKRLGRKLVLWRDDDGRVVAMPGACPHRGAALEQGRIQDGELECPWHGFRYRSNGACTSMPCEGKDATPPRAMSLPTWPVREEHGLVWLFYEVGHRTPDDALPEIPFFEEVAGADLRGTHEASYILPYHYSRMVETNLDLHHTPFAHRGVVPNRPFVEPFEARIEGDRIRTSLEMRKEGSQKSNRYRADCLLPNLGLIGFGDSFCAIVAATPVDEHSSWMWFRYYEHVVGLWPISKLLTWFGVRSELWLVQPQDWKIFAGLPGGTVDDVDYHFVRADQGIALYRRRRRELLDAAAAGRKPAAVREAV
jgi:phenylpropionate dioxygenase-like ring-hydroxylating dioxygenase large terminal subunit